MISLNVKLWSNVILVVLIVTIELSIVRKKNRVPSNVTKVQSEVMWVLPNVIIERSNLRIKKYGTTKCDKNRVKCDVGTT